MNLCKKTQFPIFLYTAIIIFNVYGPVSARIVSYYEEMYTVTSAGMSGGRKWEDFRWEDGWPVERAETKVTSGTMDEQTAPDETAMGEEMPTDPAGADNNTTNNPGQVISCLNSQQAAAAETSTRSGESGTSDNWQDQSVLSESEDEDTSFSDKVDLGSGYLQCRAAREAANIDSFTNISCNENAMQTEQKTGDKVGSMDIALDRDIEGCFKGSRIEKNGILVNQFLSCSFDPSTHICITCSNEHSILGGGGAGLFCSSGSEFCGHSSWHCSAGRPLAIC